MGSKLSNPKVHAIMVDGSDFVAQTLNIDLLKWERTAAKNKWPDFRSVPIWWMTFLAWSAGQRSGDVPATVTWEVFSGELCAEVSNPDNPDGEVEAVSVPPTYPAVGTG